MKKNRGSIIETFFAKKDIKWLVSAELTAALVVNRLNSEMVS
jgi:hypothetical protein